MNFTVTMFADELAQSLAIVSQDIEVSLVVNALPHIRFGLELRARNGWVDLGRAQDLA